MAIHSLPFFVLFCGMDFNVLLIYYRFVKYIMVLVANSQLFHFSFRIPVGKITKKQSEGVFC